MRGRPDLIVPIKDRRQHKRYLTLRNFAIACAVAFVAFMAVSAFNEIHRPAANDYGRLERRMIPPPPVAQKPMEVVPETPTPVDDRTSTNPIASEPWLGADTSNAAVVSPPSTPAPNVAQGDHVAVVGGPEGVTIVQQKRKRAVLAGGFGR